MTTSEKVAYLKGLCEGMGIDGETREGKIFQVIIDVLEDLALDLAETRDTVHDVTDSMNEISDDLAELEDEFYECCCSGCSDGPCDDEEDDEDEDEEDESAFYSVECPGCGYRVTVDEDTLDAGSFECPECGEVIDFSTVPVTEVDFDEDEESEDEEDGD